MINDFASSVKVKMESPRLIYFVARSVIVLVYYVDCKDAIPIVESIGIKMQQALNCFIGEWGTLPLNLWEPLILAPPNCKADIH